MSLRRSAYKRYLLLLVVLLSLLSLPLTWTQKMRAAFAATWVPLWKKAGTVCSSSSKYQIMHNEYKRLESENHLLRLEVAKLKTLLDQQGVIEAVRQESEAYASNGVKRRFSESSLLQSLLLQAIPASVIYRDPASWTSSFWISVGEETNEKLEKKMIQKNSPVVVGRGVVGAIDYVGKKQSRVRLITDLGLRPSVRAVRGHPQVQVLMENMDVLLKSLRFWADIPLSSEELTSLASALQILKNRLLEQSSDDYYLAKGIVQGRGTPLWRGPGQKLRGIGFNYDFGDDEGPARDLQTGKPIDSHSTAPAVPLLKIHDLLVTTGMDGVFPAGLRVAEVTKIFPLKEGGYTYDIEATPIVGNLDELYTVFVIPSLGFDFLDQPR